MFLQCLQHGALKDLHQKKSKIWSDNMATVAKKGALAKHRSSLNSSPAIKADKCLGLRSRALHCCDYDFDRSLCH